MTKRDRNEFKIIFAPLSITLTVNKLSQNRQDKVIKEIRDRVETKNVESLLDIYDLLITECFKDNEIIFEKLKEVKAQDEESTLMAGEYESCMYLLYEQVVVFYPEFDIQVILQDFNVNSAFMDDESVDGELEEQTRKEQRELEEARKRSNIVTLEKINNVRRLFKAEVIGQDEAIEGLIDILKLASTKLTSMASIFFVGPSGTGKTKLSKLFSDIYCGNFVKINCAEYQTQHDYVKLIGAPPGYVGFTGENFLKTKADKSNAWVFLFDEIEKAHPKFFDFLLNLLDEGTISDNVGNVLDFSRSVFVFTSNEGIDGLSDNKVSFSTTEFDYTNHKEDVLESVKKKFTTAFLGRMGSIVFFNPLSKDTLRKIVTLELKTYPVIVTNEVLDFLIEKGYDQKYGARHLEKAIKKYITLPLANTLLNNKVPKEGKYYQLEVGDDVEEIFIVNTKKQRVKAKVSEAVA